MFSKFKLPRVILNNAKWLEKKQTTILSAAFIITAFNIISSLSGLIRERFLIKVYFNTVASQQAYEAFQVAFQIPDLLFQLIVLGALSAAFIPIFTQYKKKDEQEAFHITNIFMNLLLLVFFVTAILAFIFAEPLTVLRTGQAFTPDQIKIAANLTRFMLLAQFFFAISNFMTGILQSYQRFIIPSLAPLFYNFGILIGVFVFAPQFGIYAAGLGVIIGAFLHMAIQLPFALRTGFRFKLSLNIRHPGVKQLIKLVPLRVLTLSVNELQNLGLTFFATTIGNLSFVVVKLALRLMTIPIRLFGVPISQASLPFLSEQSEDVDKERFKKLILQSLNQISFLALPASMLLLILRLPIVRLVFGTDNFPWKTTVMTGKVVAVLALSVAMQAMVQLLIRAFHALKDTVVPFVVSLLTVGFYLLISYLLVFIYHIDSIGIAIATTVAAFLELSLFLILLERKLKGLFFNKDFILPQIKIITSGFLMAVFLYLPFRILDELVFDTSKTIELMGLTIVTATVGILVYIYFVVLFDIKEFQYFVELAGKFGKWKKPLAKTDEVLVDIGNDGDDIRN
jgi:putative peptidoglycan lipid II flippase